MHKKFENSQNATANKKDSTLLRRPIKVKTISRHYDKLIEAVYGNELSASRLSYTSITTWLLKNLFWTAVYLFGFYFALQSIIEIIVGYKKSPSIFETENKQMKDGDNITFPNVTICIPKSYMNLSSHVSLTNEAAYTQIIDAFFNETTTDGVFNMNNATIWNDEIYLLIWKYLAMIYEGEMLFESRQSPFINWEDRIDKNTSAILDYLTANITAFNITIDQVKSIFDGKLSKFTKRFVPESNGYAMYGYYADTCLLAISVKNEAICASSINITFIDGNKFCFALNNNTGKIGDHIWRKFYIYPNDNQEESSVINDAITIYINEEADISLENIAREEGAFILKPNDGKTLFASMTEVNLLPVLNGERRCSEEKKLQDCLNDCRANLIMSLYECRPQTLPIRESASVDHHNVKNCTLEHYKKCLNYTENEDSLCKNNCLPKCQRSLFTFQSSYFSQLTHDAVEFELRILLPQNTMYTEKARWSFSEFIGALGGALGFWLGLDIVVLIELFLKPFILLIRKLIKKPFENQENMELRSEPEADCAQNETSLNFRTRARAILCKQGYPKSVMWYIEKLIWIIVYGIGGGYTVYCCNELIQQYISKETYSLTKLMINESFTLPPITFCLDSGFSHPLNIWSYESGVMDTFYPKYLINYFKENTNGTVFLQEEYAWPMEMLYIVKQYLSIVEMAGKYCKPTYDNPCTLHSAVYSSYGSFQSNADQSDISNQVNAMKSVLEPQMIDWNITITSLRQKMDTEFKRSLQLQAIFFGTTNYTNFTSQLQFLSFADLVSTETCYNLLTNVTFKDPMDRLNISFNMSQFSDYCLNSDFCSFNFTIDPLQIYTTASFRPNDITKTRVIVKTHSISEISLNINEWYKNLSTTENPKLCEAAKDQKFCVKKYQIRYIEEKCNCSPINWPHLISSDANLCTLAEYKDCLGHKMKFPKLEDMCPPSDTSFSCEYVTYGVQQNEILNPYPDNIARFVIFVNDFTYLSFEEVYDMTPESFLASLGGMLGLVLGLDMRFIATLIIIPLVILVQFGIKRLMTNPNSILYHEKIKKLESYYRKIQNNVTTITGIPVDTTMSSFLT